MFSLLFVNICIYLQMRGCFSLLGYMFNIKIYSYEKVKFCIGNRLYFKPVYWNDLFILFKR